MSRFLVSYGADARHHLASALPGGANWQHSTGAHAAFALQGESFSEIAEHSSLFASPRGECAGLLAGTVFNLAEKLAAYSPDLPPAQRLGLLLHELYQRYQADFADQLDGSFAIAMALGDILVIARDAMGERPLYLLEHPRGVLVADRMAPLIAHTVCERRLHAGAVADFLCTGFCPFERTPVQSISKVPPGATWTVTQQGIRRHHYHQLRDIHKPVLSLTEQVREIYGLLRDAVEKRWIAGEKAALLLSGGLDSSLVGALVGGDRLLGAYSLSFGERYRNELGFSSLMARHLGIPHRVITVHPKTVRDEFQSTMAILDEPIGDPLTVPNVIVAREVARHTRVVFNGEGGDPLFGGPKNLPMLAAEAFGAPGLSLGREDLYLMSYNKGSQYVETLLTPAFRGALNGHPSPARLLSPYFEDTSMSTLLSRLMLINTRLKGAAQILPKVFKVTTAAGLVARSPLFDRRLGEAAFRLAPDLKLRGTVEKFILKEAAKPLLPPEIVQRPKSGMLVPVQHWFRNELKGFARDALLSPETRLGDVCDRNAIRDLLAFKGGGVRGYHGDRIWLLLALEFWMRGHRVSSG